MNSLSDDALIGKLYEAAKSGVEIKLIIRGIFCMYSQNKKFTIPIKAKSQRNPDKVEFIELRPAVVLYYFGN